MDGLKYGLNHCFVDKNKFIRRNIAVELENLSNSINRFVQNDEKEAFHEFLCKYTNKFTQNVYHSKDDTFNKLKSLRNNDDIVILAGDKDSSVVIMNKTDYQNKVNSMIEEGIQQRKYNITDDTTLKDLEHFQDFLYRNFKDHKYYKDMWPTSNQPARFFASAKTRKFDNFSDINVEQLKLRPIIDQSNTYTYNAAKVIGDYLKPLAKNEYVIDDTLTFPTFIKQDRLPLDEEYVSYDVESLFTSIPIEETISYIIEQIYDNNILKPICSRLIFKRLLERLTTGCIFSVNGQLIRQIDGCPMGGPISSILSGIFMNKMEQDTVKTIKPRLYKRYVDDTFSSRKKGQQSDPLFESLNQYHPNIALTIETNPTKFLDTEFHVDEKSRSIITKVYKKPGKFPAFWSSQIPKR